MYFDPHKCCVCGGLLVPYKSQYDLDGWRDCGFSFGNDACYEKIAAPYLTEKFSKTWGDSPEYKHAVQRWQEHMREYGESAIDVNAGYDNWKSRRRSAYYQAKLPLFDHLCRLKQAHTENENREWWKKTHENDRKVMAHAEARHRILIADLERKDAVQRQKDEEFAELIKPKPIPDKIRFEHTHILGPSGAGKTTLLEHLFLEDIKQENPPAYVIIDPKGLMVERISRLDVFNPRSGRLNDRLILIDPTRASLPALSMFKPEPSSNARILNQLIETFGYVFSSSEARLTQRQSIPFAYVVRLVFSMAGDINTLMDLLEDTARDQRFAEPIARLSATDSGARRFFEKDFYTVAFNDTRQQIKTRLYEIISRPELMQMFAAPHNKLSLPRCLQERKIVLVNTGMAQLGSKGSALLGRYIISATLNAAFARSSLPKKHWNPAYLVIDEFQDFADEDKTPELLRLAREYNLGVVLSHQSMHCNELNESLRTSISTNTSIKYASSPEGVDLSYAARDLRCEQEFLAKQQPSDNHAAFACYARGMKLDHPFVVECPFGAIEKHPKMPERSYELLLKRNDASLTGIEVPQASPEPSIVRPNIFARLFKKPLPPIPVVPSPTPPTTPPKRAKADHDEKLW